MDHFPSLDDYRLTDEPLRPAVWLGFDHGDHNICALAQYPLIRGWDSAQIQAMRDQGADQQFSADSLAMIQSWMFLGALEALTHRHISEADFIRRKLKRAVVHTGFLRTYLVNWIRDTADAPSEARETLVTTINHVLSEVQFWCFKLAASVSASIDAESLTFHPSEVDSAARLLTLVGETINSAKAHLSRPILANTRGFTGCYTPDEATRLVTRLVNKGWCPFMARMLSTYRYSVAEYAAFYNKIRTASMPSHKTSLCTEERCRAYDIGTEYKTRHMTSDCCCPSVSPPVAETLSLLSKEKIPVVSCKNLKGDDIELEVACSTTTMDGKGYVAFSHVWSDGMGSNTEDGLPRCVLEVLLERAQKYGRQHIWIDSLCVPREKSSRNKAIQLMAKTYKDASITVVLDSSIRTASFDLTPRGIEHTLLSLVTSTWMQRLWTLQEACLSRLLIFQFRNIMATSIDIYLGLVKALNDHWHVNPVVQVLANEFLKLISSSEETVGWLSKKPELGHLSRMLQRRRTSKLRDETAAVAGLMNVNVAPLLETDSPDERMTKFLVLLGRIPSDIIMSPLPRLDLDGFRWAPKSFMSHENTHRRWGLSTGDRAQWAECLSEGGLRGSYGTVTLSEVACLVESSSVVYRLGRDVFKATMLSPKVSKNETCEFDTVATIPHLQEVGLSGFHLAAALMSTSSKSTGKTKTDVATYEFRGRIMIAAYSWRSTDCREYLVGTEEGIREIRIV